MIEIFDEIIELPNDRVKARFDSLKGLDDMKERLVKEGMVLLYPTLIDQWSEKAHGKVLPFIKRFHDRPPLMIFAGDIGTGKTTMAQSFGDAVARAAKIPIYLLHVSLKVRGQGGVGEASKLILECFRDFEIYAEKGSSVNRERPLSGTIMVVDEADALAQSREQGEMHHEDRAGVNAVIRGIDKISEKRLPALLVMCTNRVDAIDPAVMRRASAQYNFQRPEEHQRFLILSDYLGDVLKKNELEELAKLTGPHNQRKYGYTCSDLTLRLIPQIVLEAFPDKPITFEMALAITNRTEPTRPFVAELYRAERFA